MSTTRQHSTNDLGRFRYTSSAWWEGFNAGRRGGRELAMKQAATWDASDWMRGAASRIREGAEQ